MNLSDLRIYITARYATPLTGTEIDQHINEAYKDLSRIFTPDANAEESIPTASGGFRYYVPDCRSIKEVRTSAAGERLREISYAAVLHPRRSGTPTRWFPYGESSSAGTDVLMAFGLDPIPDASESVFVRFEPEPVDLSGDSAIPDYIPEEYHHLIAWGALAAIAGHAEDYGVAQYWDTQYRSAYNGILVKLGRTAPTNFPTVSMTSQPPQGGKK